MTADPPSSAAAYASALDDIVKNADQPWPAFTVASQAAAFEAIQAALAAESPSLPLWQALDSIDVARIESIRSDYFAAHPGLSEEETAAWNAVGGAIEHVFAIKNELYDFLDGTEKLLTDMQLWLTDTIAAVDGWVTLGEQPFQLGGGGDGRTLWSMLLAPVAAIPTVGGAMNKILNGVVILCTSDPALQPNPELQQILGTAAEMNSKAAAAVAAVLKRTGDLKAAAVGNYGKLIAMHDLVAGVPASQWDRDQFSAPALDAAEVEVWKPMLAAGWRIEIPVTNGDGYNSRIDQSDHDAFQALMKDPVPKCLFYDQVSGLTQNHWWSGYWARCRLIANDFGDYWPDAGAGRLFDVLGVPREDVFNGQNGWAMPISNGMTNFNSFPYRAPRD